MGKTVICRVIIFFISVMFFQVMFSASVFPAGRFVDADRELSASAKELKDTLKKDPKNITAMIELGNIYYEMNDYTKACKTLAEAKELMPGNPVTVFYLARACFMSKKTEMAEQELEIFVQEVDKHPALTDEEKDFYVYALDHSAYIYEVLKKYDKMLVMYKKIIKMRPDDQRARYNLGVCYYRYYHNRSRAYHQLQQAIKMNKDEHITEKAVLLIDYMRSNPDSRYEEDLSFLKDGA